MINKHFIFSAALITAYLGRIIFGNALHLTECPASISACVVNGETLAQQTAASPLIMSDCCAPLLLSSSTQDEDGRENRQHEPTDCWTCYVLSQAGDTPNEITLPTCIDSVYSISTTLEDWQLQAITHVFLVRGPPEFLLQRS